MVSLLTNRKSTMAKVPIYKPKSKAVVPPASKKTPPKPLLPQHHFPEPYSRLLTFGETQEHEEPYKIIARQLQEAGSEKAVIQLIAMALDVSYYDYWRPEAVDEDPRTFTSYNAVKVLTEMGEAACVGVEQLMPLLDSDDDILREEMPFYYSAVGAYALPALMIQLADNGAESFLRVGASSSLEQIAEDHSEVRDEVVRFLTQMLETEQEDHTLNAYIISDLLDLGARESLPAIEKAFEEDRVDQMAVQLYDVHEHFDLPRAAQRPTTLMETMIASAEQGELTAGLDDEEDEAIDTQSEPPAAGVPYVAPYKIGRNEPCPCGSGLKYKKCHGA